MNFQRYCARIAICLVLGAGRLGGAPFISSFTPNYGASNDPANITINGGGFYPGTVVVKFNGVQDPSAAATDTSGTAITAHVRPGTPKGTGPVFVSINGVMAPTNNGVVFTVIGPSDPYAASFSPATGVAGSTVVTLTGTHFTGTTAVKFNGGSASFVPPTVDTTLTATVPNGASTGPISVEKTGASTFVSTTNFFFYPTITSFAPASGRAGTNVVIKGNSFTGAIAVKFGAVNAAGFSVDSNSQITATAPASVATGPIEVDAPAGNFSTSTNFVVQPTVSGFSPGFGSVGTSVTVSGANFNVGTPSVKFGGVAAAAPTGVTFGQLTVLVPAGATNAPITVTTSDGLATSSQTFYVPATIASFTPTNSAPGTTVVITGSNFLGATQVNFNGLPASSFTASNNSTIGAMVPAGLTTGPISVTTPAGAVTNAALLFYAAPSITSFTPTHGVPGNSVLISGVNFLGATVVSFNGTNASFTVTNNTTIGATVPANAQSGPITVVAPAGTNTTTAAFTLDYMSDVGVNLVGAPNPVFIGSNLLYTLSVFNNGPFAAPNVMLTETLPASVTLKTATTTQGSLNTNGNPILGTLGTLASGGAVTVQLTVVPHAAGAITNAASVSSDNPDPAPANNTSNLVTTVWPLPLLSINLATNLVKVSWPAPLSNFTLQYKTALGGNGPWTNNPAARSVFGNAISVTETNLGTARFYRLTN